MIKKIPRAIGHEIAATIRFGAIPAAVAPQRGDMERTDASSAVVAGLGELDKREPEKPRD